MSLQQHNFPQRSWHHPCGLLACILGFRSRSCFWASSVLCSCLPGPTSLLFISVSLLALPFPALGLALFSTESLPKPPGRGASLCPEGQGFPCSDPALGDPWSFLSLRPCHIVWGWMWSFLLLTSCIWFPFSCQFWAHPVRTARLVCPCCPQGLAALHTLEPHEGRAGRGPPQCQCWPRGLGWPAGLPSRGKWTGVWCLPPVSGRLSEMLHLKALSWPGSSMLCAHPLCVFMGFCVDPMMCLGSFGRQLGSVEHPPERRSLRVLEPCPVSPSSAAHPAVLPLVVVHCDNGARSQPTPGCPGLTGLVPSSCVTVGCPLLCSWRLMAGWPLGHWVHLMS